MVQRELGMRPRLAAYLIERGPGNDQTPVGQFFPHESGGLGAVPGHGIAWSDIDGDVILGDGFPAGPVDQNDEELPVGVCHLTALPSARAGIAFTIDERQIIDSPAPNVGVERPRGVVRNGHRPRQVGRGQHLLPPLHPLACGFVVRQFGSRYSSSRAVIVFSIPRGALPTRDQVIHGTALPSRSAIC
ncbi:hypothetical protein [Rhodococcus oxybenzonivorans]|uniref:hypothetical protein n=1 Tax=Rhodococcus oxybenzonivorans TaxID=1990687 RepID=UPI001E284D03|nr:hypothetical protein [Rhodococcus oxybenzonivorans]